MSKLKKIIKADAVLIISAFAAVITCFFKPPDLSYIDYINFDVLILLFSLMTVVAGLSKLGVLTASACKLLTFSKTSRELSIILVFLTFFSSMLMTNDVALITFIPFSLAALRLSEKLRFAPYVITLQTVAANIGSTLTPVGNPQNLFLYSNFHISIPSFFSVTTPIVLLGGIILVILNLFVKPSKITVASKSFELQNKRKIIVYSVLFALCLLSVLHIIGTLPLLLIVCATLLIFDKRLFLKVDYSLLLTFLCFFIFVGNLKSLPIISTFLTSFIKQREFLCSIVFSQVISNVPAAVMLSSFTENYKALLAGTNIGGLGTLVASLASLISFKLYCKEDGARPLYYLAVFFAVNFPLLILTGAAYSYIFQR
ncbi:MAG: SLC13 family permease [Bacillota bacterium]|nr:SLC13 family permease [Bacillota bacterium]